jgi:hypothetical protein
MPTIQISKIQLRRGPEVDLPIALDDGEFGFTTDTGRLFIGQNTPTDGTPNFDRDAFPFQNIEVLTENTPASVFSPVLADNQAGFITSLPLIATSGVQTLQIYDTYQEAQDVVLDLPVSGVNASIQYFVFDVNHMAMRHGVLHVVWNSSMIAPPFIADQAFFGVGNVSDLIWSTGVVSGVPLPHVVLRCINATGTTPTVIFRIDRPVG